MTSNPRFIAAVTRIKMRAGWPMPQKVLLHVPPGRRTRVCRHFWSLRLRSSYPLFRKRRSTDRDPDQHCVFASGWLASILKCLTSIMLSRLHFGQNSGNAFNTVSGRSCNRVFAPHIGHRTHCFSSVISFIRHFPAFCIRIRFRR